MNYTHLVLGVFFFIAVSCSSSPRSGSQDMIDTYPNGVRKAKYTLVDGKLEGTKLEYYEDGTLMSKEEWKDSLKDGKAIYYNKDGMKIQEGEYKKNSITGCWMEYYDNGNMKTFRDYSVPDSIQKSVDKLLPNRYLDFTDEGEINFDVSTMYYELSPVDTMGGHYFVLSVKCLPANTSMRIIYTHKDSSRQDTAYENPVAFLLRSDHDYVSGIVQCVMDSVPVDEGVSYYSYESYFDSRRPTYNLPKDMLLKGHLSK
jgi:hypothetical protein